MQQHGARVKGSTGRRDPESLLQFVSGTAAAACGSKSFLVVLSDRRSGGLLFIYDPEEMNVE